MKIIISVAETGFESGLILFLKIVENKGIMIINLIS
jgi:hypothetical protein